MATRTRVSLEEFLAMPETEPPSELWDGEVVQKVAPNAFHGWLVLRLGSRLERYLEESGEGMAVTEVRHLDRNEERVYLPDINVWTGEVPNLREALAGGPQERKPDIAIEVLSPGDSAGRTLQRAAFYMRTGVPLASFVDPDTETVTVYRPGAEPAVHRAPDVIDAKPVLRDFTLDLSVLFAVPDNR